MPCQDVTLLNPWRFIGRNVNKDIDQAPQLTARGASKADRKKAEFARTYEGFHYASGIARRADADCHVARRTQGAELTGEYRSIAIVIGDSR
jgi:hypothetical protein